MPTHQQATFTGMHNSNSGELRYRAAPGATFLKLLPLGISHGPLLSRPLCCLEKQEGFQMQIELQWGTSEQTEARRGRARTQPI